MRVLNKSVWPFQIQIDMSSITVATLWCRENLYPGGHYEPNWYYNSDTGTWCFKDESEYLLFCLRWA